ncbi:phosphonopyruvate decarboxylase [Clostridium botulinum]|uniref:phosphonopyruvate decarboxylase n=1 Tax=Clostridium botulinum TaxID=1491 RepID=UPI000D0DCBCB|nr:phosphonopyruvate decarboxylase [Clostridium botulinum]MBD5644716.1 phosphonopyruvate decarboxylase [Clostridium botulinum]PSL98668.1 phosphonopyruvate decarboxylase [Clostridium botulinum]HDK7138012.1 phosphonopyruvate decarboxylase [Clostridium botulinum]HDK7141340.1 phosphonopyruvate decarboxylase [Clostridium botulinum]HDK7145163.1 phosphonopyruvate decarboxylase [Clostridium botulinum]
MKIETMVKEIEGLGIGSIVGVPDSTLKEFCDYMNYENPHNLKHYVPANEGAAVGLASGIYLGTGKPACIYMQNSGIGNAINPIVSLLNKEVYDIPTLFMVGWRGEPNVHDEPQHKFQGMITKELFDVLNIKNEVISSNTTDEQLKAIFEIARNELNNNRQFAIIIKKGTFEKRGNKAHKNSYEIIREDAIKEILKQIEVTDMIVSTTGKISREVYEESDIILGGHKQNFLTVGSMGHSSMIALGLAKEHENRRIYCIDGDGSILMHMGALAFIAKQNPENLIHIVLNNDAHESVGGMPTCAVDVNIGNIAQACGYPKVYHVYRLEELTVVLKKAKYRNELCLIEVKVSLESRADLGRPKESARENKKNFMKYHGVK